MDHVENEHLDEGRNDSSSNQSPDESNNSPSKSNDSSSSSEQNLSESFTNNQEEDDNEIKVVLECIKNQKVKKQGSRRKSTSKVATHLKKNSTEGQNKPSSESAITTTLSSVLPKQTTSSLSNMPELRSRHKDLCQETNNQQSLNYTSEEPTVETNFSIHPVLAKSTDFAPELRSHDKVPSGLPKIPTVVTTGPAVRCGDCGDSFVDYLELMEHVEDVHLPAAADESAVQASSQDLKRKIGPKSKTNKRQKLDNETAISVATENQTMSVYSSTAVQIFNSSLASSTNEVPSKAARETNSSTQQLDSGLTDRDKSVEKVKLPSLKRPADGPQVLTTSKRQTRTSFSSSLVPDSELPSKNTLTEESATHLNVEPNKISTTNQRQKKIIHESVPLLPCYISIKTPDRETPLTCGQCGLKFQLEKDILQHAERLHLNNFETEDSVAVESVKSGVKRMEIVQLETEVRERMGRIEKLISTSREKSPCNLFPKCNQCGDIFLDNTYLEEHLRNIHQVIYYLYYYLC
jgi:uncharacterized C2H2 Zn-finger protein